MVPKKKCGTACIAVGCSMRPNTNLLSEIKMIAFPTDPVRREQWKIAVGRKNWSPSKYSRICSNHFISGKPSKDPNHPDYVPSIFKHRENLSVGNIERYDRLAKRKKTDDSNELNFVKEFKDAGTMTDISMNDIELTSQHKEKSIFENIICSDKKLKFYSKLPSSNYFVGLLSYLIFSWKPSTSTKLSPSEQLLLVFMKLRLGLLNLDLAYRFNVSSRIVSSIIRDWTTRMAQRLSRFISWPEREMVNRNRPRCFKNVIFKDTICILDCSEIFIDTPFNLDARAYTYSNYKHHNTVKFLVSCTPSGAISFISKLYGGRASDKEIAMKCGIMDLINHGDAVLADRGFLIGDVLKDKGAKLILPAFTKGKKQLTASDVSMSRRISKARVHIERCIRRIKCYRILKSHWAPSFLTPVNESGNCLGDNILIILSALCNMSKPALL